MKNCPRVPAAHRRGKSMRNETLQDINQSTNSLPALEERRFRLLERIGAARENSNALKLIHEKRMGRVTAVKDSRVSSVFNKIFGRSKSRQNKDMLEMLAAKYNYEKEREHLQDLEEENEDLLRRIINLQQRKKVMQEEISRREKEISDNANHDLFETYKRMIKESSTASEQLVETQEAIKAARKVLESAKESEIELENAENWTTSDMWGGSGIVSRTTTLGKIDHAQTIFNRLSTQLEELERELGDVHLAETTILSTITMANHMVEFWFDNILSGKDVATILRGNRAQIRVLATQIHSLIALLEKNEEELTRSLELLEQGKADLIVTCRSCQSEDGEEAACEVQNKEI